MSLISPVQIKGGKKLFEDVASHESKIVALEKSIQDANDIINKQLSNDTSKINSYIVDIYNSFTSICLVEVNVDEEGQKEFLLDLSNIEDKEVSSTLPIKVTINGIAYYEPTFTLNFKESKLVWNDDTFNIDTDDTIKIEIPLHNTTPELMEFTDMTNKALTKLDYIISRYGITTNNPTVTVTDDQYYVKFIKNIGILPMKVVVQDDTYNLEDTFSLDIGNSSCITNNYFKVIGDDLFIAVPILFTYFGDIIVNMNSSDYNYTMKKNWNDNNLSLSVGSVAKLGSNVNHSVTLIRNDDDSYTINEERTNGTSYVGYELQFNESILPATTPMLIKRNYSDTNENVYEVVKTLDDTYSYYITNYYKNGLITAPKDRTVSLTIFVPTYGFIKINLIVEEPV